MVGVFSSRGQAENQASNKQASLNEVGNINGNGKKDEDGGTQQDLSPLKQTADRWEDAVFCTKEFGRDIAVCSMQEKVSPESKLGLSEPFVFFPLLLPVAFLSYLSQGIRLLFSSLERLIKGFQFPIQAEWLFGD